MTIRIRGTIVVRELDIVLTFTIHGTGIRTNPHPIVIGYELHISDHEYHIAAHIISRALHHTVEWQDVAGMKHLVRPNDHIMPFSSCIDPRYALPVLANSIQ